MTTPNHPGPWCPCLACAVSRNRRRQKYRRLVSAICRKFWDYADGGKADKRDRVIEKLAAAIRGLSYAVRAVSTSGIVSVVTW